MIWYVYDKNRSGSDTKFFNSKDKARAWAMSRAASTGGDMAVRWCHKASVPSGTEIN